jgi:hypothetical protein
LGNKGDYNFLVEVLIVPIDILLLDVLKIKSADEVGNQLEPVPVFSRSIVGLLLPIQLSEYLLQSFEKHSC